MTLSSFRQSTRSVDWPSLFVLIACYAAFGVVSSIVASWSALAAVMMLGVVITLHSSLQHEALHGHILRSDLLRYGAVFPALGVFVPYERFRDTHLAHHHDIHLTDPFEDPESNFQHPDNWQNRGAITRLMLEANNTLLGRMVLGPAIGLIRFYIGDAKAMMRGDAAIMKAYVMHGLGLVPVVIWVEMASPLTYLEYLAAAYIGMGILKIRTYLEHRAHEDVEGRTVIVEDRGIFAFLFLNNNYHALHHQDPSLKWYELPRAFEHQRDDVLTANKGYRFTNYRDVFRHYLLKRKDPVVHPLR